MRTAVTRCSSLRAEGRELPQPSIRETIEKAICGEARVATLREQLRDHAEEAAEVVAEFITAKQEEYCLLETVLYLCVQSLGRRFLFRLQTYVAHGDMSAALYMVRRARGSPIRLISLFGMAAVPEAQSAVQDSLREKLCSMSPQNAVSLLVEEIAIATDCGLRLLLVSSASSFFQALDISSLLIPALQTKSASAVQAVLQAGYFFDVDHLCAVCTSAFKSVLSPKSVSEAVEETLALDSVFVECPEVAFALRKVLAEKLNTSDGIRDFATYYGSLVAKGPVPAAVSSLFLLLASKDLFEQLYRKDALLRVLEGSNTEVEREAVEVLSGLSSAGIFQRAKNLLLDLSLSEEQSLNSGPLRLTVVSYSSWSAIFCVYGIEPRRYFGYQPRDMPAELLAPQSTIELEYKSRFKGKKLQWVHLCDKLQLKYGPHTLTLNFVQALILLSFNHKSEMREEEIVQRLSDAVVSAEIIKAEIAHLGGILQRTQNGFKVDITSKKLHLTFYHIPNSAPVSQNERITSEDRKPLIEATIVRIMKERQQISHKNLVLAVQEKLISRCVIEKAAIKERIDLLVDREFLEREEGIGYRYKA